MVLLMSPGTKLRLIFRNYPGFVNKTYVDWIHKWPLEALNAVVEKVLINVGYLKLYIFHYEWKVTVGSVTTHFCTLYICMMLGSWVSDGISACIKRL